MVDIRTFLAEIEYAPRGEDVRDSIIKALTAMKTYIELGADGDIDAEALYQIFMTGRMPDISQREVFDEYPTAGSRRAVTSNGLWTVLGNIGAVLDAINGEEI